MHRDLFLIKNKNTVPQISNIENFTNEHDLSLLKDELNVFNTMSSYPFVCLYIDMPRAKSTKQILIKLYISILT